MAILQESQHDDIRDILAAMEAPVTAHVWRRDDCDTCEVTYQLLDELAGLAPQLTTVLHDLDEETDLATTHGVDKAPAITLEGSRVFGVRYYGVPGGYEFASLLEDLVDASKTEVGLTAATREFLDGLTGDLHLQVFVTPTCPYCPGAVRLAHKMAFSSDKVSADAVAANEFPELSARFQVMGVPKTVVNDGAASFEGAMPEPMVVERLAGLRT